MFIYIFISYAYLILIYKHIFFSLTDTPGTGKRYAYPDLDFLENDVGLWDTFFSHGKNSSKFQSVLRPPLPIDEYLKQKSNPSGGGGSAETPTCSHNLPQKTGSTPASENPKPIIYDSASLRTLLPGRYIVLLLHCIFLEGRGATPTSI